jgi:hypothetical protein
MKNTARDFITMFIGATVAPMWFSSLPNDKGSGGPSSKHTRDIDEAVEFCERHDVPGRAVYYCASSIVEKSRNVENVAETPILWADIDYKNVVEAPEQILERVRKLPLPPSRIHATGNGLHLIYELAEPFRGDPRPSLRRLADVVGGDRAVCHPAALLRMPGTHNSKNGAWKLVKPL